MQDLTSGSITRHLLKTTSFMLVMMVFQTLYFLIDLYWVGRLGTAAVAGVGIAGNLTFIVLALMQMLGVGTTAVVSHAAGRKDHEDAQHLFNQSQALAVTLGVSFLIVGLAARMWYATAMAADADTATQTAQCLENVRTILRAAGSDLQHVLRCGVFLIDMKEFDQMNGVYSRVFGEHRPARTTIQAAALPGVGLRVEIDCIAYVP